jgi:membrane-bound lytic murein transglycosylase A
MRRVPWAALDGWSSDDHAAAWAAFSVLPPPADPRAWFEAGFEPHEVAARSAHYTGYYEPVVPGSLTRTGAFAHPLHAPPDGLTPESRWHDRATIAAENLLAGRELVWLSSAIEAFLAQVQGAVRVALEGGGTLRLGFAGKNGHPYRSIGAELVQRGAVPEDRISADAIRHWCESNPAGVQALLNLNPSYVFFRPLDLPGDLGPPGAAGRPLTPHRSLAVDPAVIPLGTPVWVDCPGLAPRLMVAQDVGTAIKGAGRGDIFLGTGPQAGAIAGALNARGRMVALLPKGET